MKILVAIASYGTTNDLYLRQLIGEYMSMSYQIDIVVVSNIRKNLHTDVRVIVGLPSTNPWSLPFAHKSIFVERLDRYDLFIYSEDDTLITQQHIEAFLQVNEVLHHDEIAGFLRSEEGPDGTVYYSTIHSHYHWDINSVCRRGNDTFAFFTNEHGACYILTQTQLRRSIASSGFAVPPHEGKYDMLVTAATDPYTQCGFRKLICISRLADFTCKHLTNKYIGRTGLDKAQVEVQISALLEVSQKAGAVPTAIRVETGLLGTRWTKSYYEPCRDRLVNIVPEGTTRVLSLGCGWGKTEETLVKKHMHVTALPLDIVIGKLAATKGIRVILETLESGPQILFGETFDVLLISNLLHLVDDPVRLLRNYREFLRHNGMLIVSCPNVKHLAIQLRRLTRQTDLRGLGNYQVAGLHQTSERLVWSWLRSAGFSVEQVQSVIEGKWNACNRITLGFLKSLWAYEFAIAARKLS